MHVVRQYDEAYLLIKVAQGDENAFTILFDKYRDKIFFFALKFLQSDTRAEDVLQEIFLKVWMSRDELPAIKNFRAWLNTITRNHIYNALRRLALEESFTKELTFRTPSEEQGSAIDSLSFGELQRALKRAISQLTPQQRLVFELSRIEGLKHEQIAEKLAISRETVKKHMTDALQRIRLQIRTHEGLVHLGILLLAVRL